MLWPTCAAPTMNVLALTARYKPLAGTPFGSETAARGSGLVLQRLCRWANRRGKQPLLGHQLLAFAASMRFAKRLAGRRNVRQCCKTRPDPEDFDPEDFATMTGGFLEGLDIGLDRRAPVEWELFERRGCFRYSGTILDLTIHYGALAPDSPLASHQT
jgi:hypothetical protein